MSEQGQFIGMPCYVDFSDIDRACLEAFGAPVLFRMEGYGEFELNIGDKWYKCTLSDLDTVGGAQRFVDSVKRIVERQTEVTA